MKLSSKMYYRQFKFRIGLIVFSIIFTSSISLAGGLVTNTNQSAAWVRLPVRNACVGIDAAYFNPAGLMKVKDGFHISLSNQSIFQEREIKNDYAGPDGASGLNESVYKGTVTALAFPTVYAVYKSDKLAFSLGFNPIGGGGGAEYKKGLPSFEINQSDLVPLLSSIPYIATDYRLDTYFRGSSTFFGLQGGISYKINEWISVASGVRYVAAKNTYEGYLKDVEVNIATGWTRAALLINQIVGLANTGAEVTTRLVTAGTSILTLADVQPLGYISAEEQTILEGALNSFGYPSETPIGLANKIFKDAAIINDANARLLDDQTVKAKQAGSGITPFFSINLSPSDNLNIGIKYEMATKLELTNNTKKDLIVGYEKDIVTELPDIAKPITMFPNGSTTRNDMPAMLSVGIDYALSSILKLSLGSNYFFDKTADYGHRVDDDMNSATPKVAISNEDIIDNNGMSLQAGLEYNISDQLLVSGGYVWANKGVNSMYQRDLTYGLATQTFGIGVAYSVSDKFLINLGTGYTMYKDDSRTFDHIFSRTGANITSIETYSKSTFMVAVGLDFRF